MVKKVTGGRATLDWAKSTCSDRGSELVVVVAVGVLAAGLFWRDVLLSGFGLISGNLGDNRLLIVLHEHWYHVLRGRDSWQEPMFFYPAENVLGFSDTLFLSSLPYAIVRALGAGVYVAFQTTLIAFTLVGFLSAYFLLRRLLGVAPCLALMGAVVSVFSTPMAWARYAAQNLYVCLAPLLVILLLVFLRELRRERWTAAAFGSLFSLLLAACFFSSFNFAWFFTFFIALVTVVSLVLNYRVLRSGVTMRRVAIVALVGIVFLASMTPFLITYLPLVAAGFTRGYGEAVVHLVEATHFLNRAGELWQAMTGPVQISDLQNYSPTPGVVLGVFVSGLYLAWSSRSARRGPFSDRDRLMLSVAIAILVAWLLVFKIDGLSLWWVVYSAVPGASAARVVVRFQYVISMFGGVLIFYCLGRAAHSVRFAGRVLVAGAAAFLVVEQYADHSVDGILRSQEYERLGDIPAPPATAEAFFIVAPLPSAQRAKSTWPGITAQIDAMLIAERFGIPTVNGYSGWSPPGWALGFPADTPTYRENVALWLSENGFRGEVVALDLRARRWIK